MKNKLYHKEVSATFIIKELGCCWINMPTATLVLSPWLDSLTHLPSGRSRPPSHWEPGHCPTQRSWIEVPCGSPCSSLEGTPGRTSSRTHCHGNWAVKSSVLWTKSASCRHEHDYEMITIDCTTHSNPSKGAVTQPLLHMWCQHTDLFMSMYELFKIHLFIYQSKCIMYVCINACIYACMHAYIHLTQTSSFYHNIVEQIHWNDVTLTAVCAVSAVGAHTDVGVTCHQAGATVLTRIVVTCRPLTQTASDTSRTDTPPWDSVTGTWQWQHDMDRRTEKITCYSKITTNKCIP